jgi:hypothetical protein
MSRRIACIALILSAAVATGAAAQAQKAEDTRVGTLTCTTSDLPPQTGADAELSCNFKAISGRGEMFTGYIARLGPADIPPGKRVLMWSVFAPKDEIDPRALAGRYAGQTGGEPPGRMVGGEGNMIALTPATGTSQIDDTPAPTVLELRLEPLKA